MTASPITGGHGGSPSIEAPDYWWYLARERLLATALRPYAGRPRTALDIGSADAPSAGWLRDLAAVQVSLDLDARGLARERNGVCGSATALPFREGAFDLVTAFDVIEHVEPESDVLSEVRRVLAPGGRLLVSVPAYRWAWTDFDVANGHHRRYTRPRAIAALEDHGFTVDRATYAFAAVFPFFAVERLSRRLRPSTVTGPEDVVRLPGTPRVLSEGLRRLSRLDEVVLRRRDLPFGSSVLVAATATPAGPH
jgi:SAM-dependent methyltransferase